MIGSTNATWETNSRYELIEFTSSIAPTVWNAVTEYTEYTATNEYGTWRIEASSSSSTSGNYRASYAFDDDIDNYWLSAEIDSGEMSYLLLECSNSIKPSQIYIYCARMGSSSVLQAFNESSGKWETLGEIGAISTSQEFTFDIITSNFYSQFRIYANRQDSSFTQPLVKAFQIISGTLKKDKKKQLVNYLMLYDGDFGNTELNECKEITGGWNLTYKSSNVTLTKNADNLQIASKNISSGSKVCMSNNPDLSEYTGIFLDSYFGSAYDSSQGGDLTFRSTSTKTSSGSWTSGFNYITHNTSKYTGVRKLQYSATAISGYLCFGSYNSSLANVYHAGVLKTDDWATLASLAGIEATTIEDILTNSSTLLAKKEAVEFMIYNCTGDFMVSAIANDTFLTALNNSTYKTLIQANVHWNKFLNMVA